MAIVTLGIDLAKNVFAVHGVDATGRPVLMRPCVARAKLLELVAPLPPCLKHGGLFRRPSLGPPVYGHTVRLIASKFVVPYRLSGKRGKNDAADAAAICEAVTRPNMRFVPPKTIEQQSQLLVHRARQGQQQAQLVDRELVATRATAEQVDLSLFDAVLRLSPCAAQLLVQRDGVPCRLVTTKHRAPNGAGCTSGTGGQALSW